MIDLMGYSVLVDNEEQAEKLQEIAISQGFEWRFGDKGIKFLYERSFQFGYEGEKVITRNFTGKHYQDKHITKKAHFNDLFKTEFIPTAMKCTQEQFEAIRPKLEGLKVKSISSFSASDYLVNNFAGERKIISNVMNHAKTDYNRVVHEEWNEEIFLKACGIKTYTLEQQLEKAKAEVARLEEEIENNKIKVGDWGKFWDTKGDFVIGKFERNIFGIYMVSGKTFLNCEKITNPQLIELLEKEMK